MLINFSNHPSERWSLAQKREALESYSSIVDLPFPRVAPDGDEESIDGQARALSQEIGGLLARATNDKHAVHIMGEMTLCFQLIQYLQAQGITCIASTTWRNVTEKDGKKEVHFSFVRFREYCPRL